MTLWPYYFVEATIKIIDWTKINILVSINVKPIPSACNVMASVFFRMCLEFSLVVLKKEELTREYYAKLLQPLNDEIKGKRPHLSTTKSAKNQWIKVKIASLIYTIRASDCNICAMKSNKTSTFGLIIFWFEHLLWRWSKSMT